MNGTGKGTSLDTRQATSSETTDASSRPPSRRYRPVRIGSVRLDHPVTQAALSGYSDWPMRRIARSMGAAYTLCEVMLDEFLLAVKHRERTRHFFYMTEDEHPVGGQLMGAEPRQFAAGAVKLVEFGFDVIDINFGCPVRKVLGRCRGGYHLGQPNVAREIMARTRDAVPGRVPVTVKLRRGIDDSDRRREQVLEIIESAVELGIAAITLHGRSVVQRYEGPSDWSFLRDVKRSFPDMVVLGSGDLFSSNDCVRMMAETGVDGVSLARGAIGNPWIFGQTIALLQGEPLPPEPTLGEQRAVIEAHYRLADQLYGERRCSQIMRKFGIKYAQRHPAATRVRDDFVTARCRADWWAVLQRWYPEPSPQDQEAVGLELPRCGASGLAPLRSAPG